MEDSTTMETPLSFGEWVKQRRTALGLTREQLADRMSCATVTIKKIEQDVRKPSQQLSELLATHLLIAEKDRDHFIRTARGLGAPPELPTTVAGAATATSMASALSLAGVAAAPPRPFVRRERELAQLQSHLTKALAGQAQIVFVAGEAGSGKSSLLLEFARQAQIKAARLVVAGGSCNAFSGAGDPYLPFRDALVMLLGESDGPWAALTAARPALYGALLPQIATALLDYAPDVIDVLAPAHLLWQKANAAHFAGPTAWSQPLRQLIEQQRGRATYPAPKQLFEQIRLLLERLAQQQPLLLLLDDVQWIDTASLNLLFHLGQRLANSRILLVCAFRPSEVNAWRGRDEQSADPHPLILVRNELQRRFGTLEINLEQETVGEGRAFVDALLDTEPNGLDQRFREELFQRTKGYPLFTVELLRAMQERGDLLPDQQGVWQRAPKLNWATLPTRVEVVIEQRIQRLPVECQESLKVASVIGEEFAAEIVALVASEPPQPVIQRLSDLLVTRHRLLKSLGSRRLRTQRLSQYKFQHILFQNYLYALLDEGQRSYLHEAVGAVVETIYAEDPDLLAATAVQLAHHFEKANLPAKSVPYLLLAGKRAMQLSAYETAIAHFEQGLAALPQLLPGGVRDRQELALLVGLGNALIAVRGSAVESVGQSFRRVLALAEALVDQEQQALALFNLWRFYSDRGDYANCHAIADQLQQLAQQSDQGAVHLTYDHVLWTMRLYAGDFAAALTHAEQGIARYQPELHHTLTAAHAGHDPGMCCRVFAAYALWYLGYPDQARQRAQAAVDLARQVAHPFSLAMALTLAAEVRLLCRDHAAAQSYLQEALALAKTHGFTSWLELGAIFQGWALAQAGDAEAGIQLMLYGLDANRTAVGEESGLHCFAQLAEAYHRANRPAEGLALLAKALDVSDKNKLRHWAQWQAELYRLQGELYLLQQGDAPLDAAAGAQIEACFQQAIALAQAQQAKATELRATVSLSRFHLRQGQPVAAYEPLAAIYHWFTEGFDTPDLLEAKTLLATF
jgi:transcriptional regulator with XRE-family HTH domain